MAVREALKLVGFGGALFISVPALADPSSAAVPAPARTHVGAADSTTETTTDTKTTTAAATAKTAAARNKVGDETKTNASHDGSGLKADNTGVNKRDRDDREVTADQQKNGKSDLQLTAEIRRAVVRDKSLSMSAHNVKIIVRDGNVTLKGPVASKDERANVERKATDIVGSGTGKVTNEIAVAP